MSKTLSLKMRDDVFSETNQVVETMHTSRNAYINDALSFYNKFMKRTLLKKQLKKESRLVSGTSFEALRELELIEDKLPK
jgi:predicted transcriptional regulator